MLCTHPAPSVEKSQLIDMPLWFLEEKLVQIRLAALTWIILVCLVSLHTATLSQVPEDSSMLSPEEFVILPWGWTSGDADAIRQIRECGFNLAGFVAPEHLDYVSEAGLKCIVSDEEPVPAIVDSWLVARPFYAAAPSRSTCRSSAAARIQRSV